MKLLTEAWAGCELDITDMYGMREYTKGARLLTHVDRESTHAASMIVNIAQVDIDKPWTVEVFDHADRLHEVAMEPGDIVYYGELAYVFFFYITSLCPMSDVSLPFGGSIL